MIKLIASDMDGTLLDTDGNVPPETYDLICALADEGVRFVASSGRRYDRLCQFFEPIRDRMDFVASNGAQVYVGGREIDREVYSYMSVQHLADTVALFDNMHLALFDKTVSYLMDDEDKFVREVDKDLPNVRRIWQLPSATVGIIKAGIFCDDGNVMDNAYVLQRELGEEFVFAPSGVSWIDAMQPRVTKATGVAQVMRAHGLAPDEVLAFGDAMNDYELIRFAGTGCAMGNGRPVLKAVADHVIGTNADHAVQRAMGEVLAALR